MTQREKILLQFSDKKNVSVEFALIDDIEKILDSANAQRRVATASGLKIADSLNNLQGDYTKAFVKAIDAQNKAKELGADDLVKLFGARAQEAKDYQNEVGKASNKIKDILNAI